VRRPGGQNQAAYRNLNVNQNINVNQTANVNISQPYVGNNYNYNYNYNRPGCAPIYTNYYNPAIYTNYSARRRYRRSYYSSCAIPFLSLGFFLSRPYSYYDYASVGYNQPYFYGDDASYQPAPTYSTGGPVADAITSDGLAAAAPLPAEQSSEQQLLTEVSNYVAARSIEEQFQITDAAFENQVWNLELAQAPAVFELSDGLYSVVAGFEGTLGESTIPSNVSVEFFVQRTDTGFEVKTGWVTSANGIPRAKLYQSPAYPDVKTWQPGLSCPFTDQPMIEIPAASEHG